MGSTGYSMVLSRLTKSEIAQLRRQMAEDVVVRRHKSKDVQARYGVTAPTLRRYVKAYRHSDEEGLKDHRNGPKKPFGKTSPEVEAQVLAARANAVFMGGRRLTWAFNIPISGVTANRILREHNLLARPKRVKEKRKDLRAVKARLTSLENLEMDVKYTTDVPNLLEGIELLNFPKYQYTVRDVKSGMVFLGYSNEISQLNARTMIACVLRTLQIAGVDTSKVIVQTDSGSEFGGPTKSHNTKFTEEIELGFKATHIKIPPRQPNFNSDVESFHNTVEQEAFNVLKALSRKEFLCYMEAYRRIYDMVRPISTKGYQSPLAILQKDYPNSDVPYIAVCQLPVVDLDAIAGYSILSKGKTIPLLTARFLRGPRLK